MSVVSLLVALVVIGVVLYIVQLLPMEATIKQIVNVVAILCVVLWLLSALGLISGGALRVGP